MYINYRLLAKSQIVVLQIIFRILGLLTSLQNLTLFLTVAKFVRVQNCRDFMTPVLKL